MKICLRICATVGVQSWTYLDVNNISVNYRLISSLIPAVFLKMDFFRQTVSFFRPKKSDYTSFIKETPALPMQVSPEWRLS